MISKNIVLDQEDLKQHLKYFLDQDSFVYDVESVGVHRGVPQHNELKWLGMSTYGRTIAIPFGHPNGDVMVARPTKKKNKETGKFDMTPAKWDEPPTQLRPSQVFDILSPLFFSDRTKGAHNYPFDGGSIAKYYGGEIAPGPYDDTIVMAWLVNENRKNMNGGPGGLGLKELTWAEYRRKYDKHQTGKKIEVYSFSEVARYLYLDCKFTWLHRLNLLEDMRDENVWDLYHDTEMPVLATVLKMEARGVDVDVEAMKVLDVELAKRTEETKANVYRTADWKINLNSPKQKVDALYGPKDHETRPGQALKPWRLTKGGRNKVKEARRENRDAELTVYDYSTDKEALGRWEGKNALVDAILEFQEVERVHGTYIRGYLGDEDNPSIIFNGRVHPSFVQYGTVTGRFSSRDPNLQNIPRPTTDLGKSVRGLFVAPPGHSLVVADYGQIELVVLAHYVGRGALYDGFFEGVDPHTVTASIVFNQPIDAVTKERRQDAKNINFAVVYGAGDEKVASMSKTSVKEAKAFLAKHQRAFPEIYEFKDQVIKVCRSRTPPHITTLLGRKRRLPEILWNDWEERSRAERQAVNSLIQGSSADLIKTAMVRVDKGLTESKAGELILSVHDELVVVTPDEKAEECAGIVNEAMTGVGIQSLVKVPLKIDMKVVKRWSEAK